MKSKLILILIIGFHYCIAQDQKVNNYDYLNQSFSGFEENKFIDSLEFKLGIKLDNIIFCTSIIELGFLSKNEELFIVKRLKEISTKLILQGTPIIIIKESSKSAELSRELNRIEKNGLIYVSIGNSCISSGKANLAIDEFNQNSMNLMRLNSKIHKHKLFK